METLLKPVQPDILVPFSVAKNWSNKRQFFVRNIIPLASCVSFALIAFNSVEFQ